MLPTQNMGNLIEVNRVYVADGCGDLPVHKAGNLIVSCWKLSLEEIAEVMTTGRVYLGVYADRQPPVFLSVSEKEVIGSIKGAIQ